MKLALYHYDSCPFCESVRRVVREIDVPVEFRNIHENSSVRRELVEATGRMTVPCLRIESDDGEVSWMPESREIIRYLQEL